MNVHDFFKSTRTNKRLKYVIIKKSKRGLFMDFIPTRIPDVILIQPKIFHDERGIFFESYQKQYFAEVNISLGFVQDNCSGSKQGVLRGLHYQVKQPQGKLVSVIVGEIFDVAVDIRRSSTTFGQWIGINLSSHDKHQLWIPPGFAHGFYVLSEWAEVLYKTTDYYAPQWERTILWNDPTLGIKWPLIGEGIPLLSSKDANGKILAEAEIFE
jgi:dTDP-4-dehydrorhamnose 3,5-epimerase